MAEDRLEVLKTYKLFIGGAFPRSESGRALPVLARDGRVLAHVSQASRKDLRDAVEAARKAQPGWARASAYNRGQVLYRMAEMMEGKRGELAEAMEDVGVAYREWPVTSGGKKSTSGQRGVASGGKKHSVRTARGSGKGSGVGPLTARAEVEAAIDRLVCFAGWADKFAQVLGCANPVTGPYYNFTVPEATGVVGVIAPDASPLLGMVSLMAPAVCSGNAVVMVAGEANPLVGAMLGEVCATSDVPAGVVNVLTGLRSELASAVAMHRDIDAVHAAGLKPEEARVLREGVAENLKRVVVREVVPDAMWLEERWNSPSMIEPFVEMKTMWHPSAV